MSLGFWVFKLLDTCVCDLSHAGTIKSPAIKSPNPFERDSKASPRRSIGLSLEGNFQSLTLTEPANGDDSSRNSPSAFFLKVGSS